MRKPQPLDWRALAYAAVAIAPRLAAQDNRFGIYNCRAAWNINHKAKKENEKQKRAHRKKRPLQDDYVGEFLEFEIG